jgi:hypothetical protein
MAKFQPPSFDSWEGKKAMNLRVLQHLFSPSVQDYTLSIPDSSVFVLVGEGWKKLQVSGPLFVLQLNEMQDPVVFVLNAGFERIENYHITVPLWATKIHVDAQKVYLKMDGTRMVMFATDSIQSALDLAMALQSFVPMFGDKPAFDPTYSHLMRVLARR